MQATTRLAGQPRLRSTRSNPASCDDAGRVGQRLGVGAEELRRDGVLVVVVGEVALALGLAHARKAVGRGELGHDEAAAGLLVRRRLFYIDAFASRLRRLGELAGVLDEAAEDRVGHSGHGRKHGRGRDPHIADGERGGDAGVLGHGVVGWVVPVLLLEGVVLLHKDH